MTRTALPLTALLTAATLISASTAAAQITTFPYIEDFESGPGGFATFTTGDWEWGTPNDEFISSAASGMSAWVTDLDSFPSTFAIMALESPPIDCTSFTEDPFLQFSQIFELDSPTVARVETSIDGGSFTKLGGTNDPGSFNWYPSPVFDGWTQKSGDAGEWRTARHRLDGAAGHIIRVRWVLDTGNDFAEGFGVDDVSVFGDFIDVGVTGVFGPSSGIDLDNSEFIGAALTNFGTSVPFGFPITYEVTGPITKTFTQNQFIPIPPNATFSFSFAAFADLSIPGVYEVRVSIDLPGDENPTNDELVLSILHQGTVDSFPYLEDFESGDGMFVGGGTNSSWEYGAPLGFSIDDAASGVNAWVTDLDGAYSPDETSFLQSPEFDLSSFQADPYLSFSHLFRFEGNDEGWLEVSYDGGPFVKLGTYQSPASFNWYNAASSNWWSSSSQPVGEWRLARHLITGGAGHRVVVRWIMNSTNSQPTLEGIGVDDVRIEAAPFGLGQAPQTNASLDVNNAIEAVGFPVSSGPPGPYFTSISTSSETFDVRVDGTPGQPVVLLAGSLSVAATQLGAIGQLDLAPASVFASGLDASGIGQFFITNINGTFELGLTIPASVIGSVISFQAAVADSDANFHLSNAVQVVFLP